MSIPAFNSILLNGAAHPRQECGGLDAFGDSIGDMAFPVPRVAMGKSALVSSLEAFAAEAAGSDHGINASPLTACSRRGGWDRSAR